MLVWSFIVKRQFMISIRLMVEEWAFLLDNELHKDKTGNITAIVLECARAGSRASRSQNVLKPQPSMQVGCLARIRARTNYAGGWVISKSCLDHNHDMSPTKARLFRCNRKLTPHMMRNLDINDVVGIPVQKSFNSAVVEAG
ncbi:unnamed protein product [Cuscuta europaea]|uniref:FAR1 domain-containing protein n=1 Tax=Cuscuta europaea TaxID=41803 RepID=A0A9P0Z4B7_CUSEU|nr:unnamed protein product [Cuscuta europaea]